MENQIQDQVGKQTVLRPSPAAMIRSHFSKSRTLVVRLIGPPGAGKTQLIEATLKRYSLPQHVAVITANPASGRDSGRLNGLCGHLAHVNTAVPDGRAIWQIISELKPNDFELVLIESAGGLGTLPDFGQDSTVAVFSAGGGDDKAEEYATLLKISSAAVLTTIDVLPLFRFNRNIFCADVDRINCDAPLFEISSFTGVGMHSWIGWLQQNRRDKLNREIKPDAADNYRENFIG